MHEEFYKICQGKMYLVFYPLMNEYLLFRYFCSLLKMLRALRLVDVHALLENSQFVVKTSVTHSPAARVPLFCSHHILTSSVLVLFLNRRGNMESDC